MEIIPGNQQKEFLENIPTSEDIKTIVNNFQVNRSMVQENAESWGLDVEFLLQQESTVLVGPFVGPGPIPTTFAGKPENVVCSVELGQVICQELQEAGYNVQQAQLVTLALTEMPRKGSSMLDCLIVPKNQSSNQKVKIIRDSNWKTAYCAVPITDHDVDSLKDPVSKMFGEFQRRKRMKKNNEIVDSVIEDVEQAGSNVLSANESNGLKGQYVNFAAALNKRIIRRTIKGPLLPYVPVDLVYYDPFLRNGIREVGRFIEILKTVGFFETNPSFVKSVDDDWIVRAYEYVGDIDTTDIMLRNSDSGSRVSYKELLKTQQMIAPCKELSYLFTLGQIVPVVYGSENRGGYYAPYATAKQQLEKLGLRPTLYRTQPRISANIDDYDTIYDYYLSSK